MSTPGSNVGLVLAVLADAAIAGAHADDTRAVDQHLLAGKAGEEVDAFRLDLLGQPPHEAVQRDDEVAVVAERRRDDREPDLRSLGQEIDDVVALDGRRERRALGLKVGNELAERRRIEHRARQDVRASLARLLEHGNRQRLAALRFCSCARRSAADTRPGPPPTIRTSTSRVSHRSSRQRKDTSPHLRSRLIF